MSALLFAAALVMASPALTTRGEADKIENLELARNTAAQRARAKMVDAVNDLLGAAHEAKLGADAEIQRVGISFRRSGTKVKAKATLAVHDLAAQLAKKRDESAAALEKKLKAARKKLAP